MKQEQIDETLVYGLMAEFDSTEHLLGAARKIRDAGYRDTDAFTPFPVHGLSEALGMRRSRLAAFILAGGIAGAGTGLLLQYWVSSIAYPHVVAGKPMFSWPSFIPVVFECTVLLAAFAAFLGMLGRNGLPRPYHPVFSAPKFDAATTDRFFLFVKATDPQFDEAKTGDVLKTAGALTVNAVHAEPSGTHE